MICLFLRRLSAEHISENADFASAHARQKDGDVGTRPAVSVAETSHTLSFVNSLNLQERSQSAVRHPWMQDIGCHAIPQPDLTRQTRCAKAQGSRLETVTA
jgi:hypothetical protein